MSFRDITTNPLQFLQPILKNQARLSRIATCILALITAWLLGQMVWLFLPSSPISPWSPNSGGAANHTKPNHQIDVSVLQRSNLFGRYQEQEKKPQPKVVQDAPKSRLNVTLVGVVISSVQEKSLAVIANHGEQATYGVGEVLDGTRAKLVAVHSDRVIVENDGRNETVMLQGIDYTKRTSPSAQRADPEDREVHNNDDREHEEQGNASKPKNDSVATTLDEVRAQIKENPQQLFQYIRMSMVKRDNDVVGYRLTAGKSPELFEEVGLQDGDIATQINGNDLSDPKVMSEIFKSIPDLTELNLTVERDGQPYDIYIEL